MLVFVREDTHDEFVRNPRFHPPDNFTERTHFSAQPFKNKALLRRRTNPFRTRFEAIRGQMTQAVQTRRFRVALSFPGEHRERVEKIAEALAGRLGRERVLYDRWYAAEFARPNLDTYLDTFVSR